MLWGRSRPIPRSTRCWLAWQDSAWLSWRYACAECLCACVDINVISYFAPTRVRIGNEFVWLSWRHIIRISIIIIQNISNFNFFNFFCICLATGSGQRCARSESLLERHQGAAHSSLQNSVCESGGSVDEYMRRHSWRQRGYEYFFIFFYIFLGLMHQGTHTLQAHSHT